MASIRAKLVRNSTMKLDQMQDLGGCRAVVDDIDGVWRLIESCSAKFRHTQRSPSDYITSPKPDGYRSYRMILEFAAAKEAHQVFAGRRVEVQIRTRLQHSWATAVEAVGLYRGESLKSGAGSSEWLRLFELLSMEFAFTEQCAGEDGRSVRVEEIKDLNAKLNAIQYLDGIKKTTALLTDYVLSAGYEFYIISYDYRTHQATVQPYYNAIQSAAAFSRAEFGIEVNSEPFSTILVNVQTAKNLAEAYPGYFGDVSLFVENLRRICVGSEAVEFPLAPQEIVRRAQTVDSVDPSAIRRRYTQWQEPSPKKKRKKRRR